MDSIIIGLIVLITFAVSYVAVNGLDKFVNKNIEDNSDQQDSEK